LESAQNAPVLAGDLIYVRPGVDIDYVYGLGFIDIAFFWSENKVLPDEITAGLRCRGLLASHIRVASLMHTNELSIMSKENQGFQYLNIYDAAQPEHMTSYHEKPADELPINRMLIAYLERR
jgi:hypothetical protein